MGKIKLNDLYDIESFKIATEQARTFDGSIGTILPRSLEYVSQNLHRQVGANQTFLQLGISVDNSGGYADFITSLKYGANGDFALDGNRTQTVGRIELQGEKSSIKVDGYSAESSYTETELQKANLENRNLLAEFINAHNMKYNEKIDTLGYVGDTKSKKQGIINYNGWDEQTSAKKWRQMTNQELSDAMRDIVINQQKGKNTKFYATKIIVSPELYTRLRVSDYKDYSDVTIAQKLERDLNITFVPTYLAIRKTDEVAVAICTDPDAIAFRVPQRLKISPVHQRGWRYYFESEFRIGGVDVLEDVGFRLKGL